MMIKRLIQLVFIALVTSACTNAGSSAKEVKNDSVQKVSDKKDSAKTIADYFMPTGDSLIIPAFDITVELSEKANQTLKAANETIIVSAMFSGVPRDTMMKEYREWGEFSIGEKQIELPAAGTAKFTNAKISKKDFELLGSKDIKILINVFSGRKSTQDNLLHCDILEEPISKVRLQKNVLKGKLLFGE